MTNRTVAVTLKAEIGQYVAGMSKAAAATMSVGDAAQKSQATSSKHFDIASKSGLLMGGAIVAGLGLAISKSMEFEKSMSAVSAATGATAGTLGDLRDAAMKAGADTQYSATEAADAITEMAKAGVSAKDIMGGGLDGALALAAAGQLDVADAAGIAAVAMTQFSLSGEDLPHVADLLAAGAGKAMGSVDDLGQALNQSGLIASAAGLTIEETTGTLAAFANAGLIGSDAGTSFKTMLQALQAPSGKAAELMSSLGLNMYDAQGNMLGAADMAGQLQAHLSGLTEEQRNSALATIFGSDAVRAANVLYKEGASGIQDWIDKTNDAGYAQEQAAALTDNLSGDIERLGGSFDTLMISLGSGAQGPLREIVQMFGGLIDGVTDLVGVFTGLPGPVQLAIGAFALWAVAGDQIKGALSGISGGLSPVKDTMHAFGDAMDYAREKGDGFGTVLRSVGDYAGGQALTALKNLGRAIGPELAAAAAVFVVTQVVSGFQAITGASDKAKAAAEGFAGALRDTSGAMDETARKAAQNALVQADIVDVLDAAGISSKDAIDGLLGQAGAQDRVNEALQNYITANPGGVHDKAAEAARGARNDYAELADQYGMTKDEAKFFADAVTGGADATDDAAAAATAAIDPAEQFQTQLQGVADAASDGKKQIDLLKTALDVLTGANITMFQAEAAVAAAMRDATGALEGLSGSALNSAGDFDSQSEAGAKAAETAFAYIDAANQQIATMEAQGDTSDVVLAKDAELRAGFIQTLGTMGITGQAAEDLANKYYGIPEERHTQITADTAQANAAVEATQAKIAALRDKSVTITTVLKTYGNAPGDVVNQLRQYESLGGAIGGIVHPFAQGGFEPMQGGVAQVVKPNTWRVIGDRVTDDEAYIPINGDRRSQQILSTTAARMGYGLVKAFADGGFVRYGTVSDETWNSLLAAGWKGDPTDGMEAIYRPAATPVMPSSTREIRSFSGDSYGSGGRSGVSVVIKGAHIVGTLDLGGGLEARIDGRIVSALTSVTDRGNYN